MVGGITNLNYALLALLCLAPFVFYLLFAGNHANRAFEVIVASGILFCLLFVPLHFVLVFDGEVLSGGELLRLLTTLPAYAFMLVPIAHFMRHFFQTNEGIFEKTTLLLIGIADCFS